MKQSVNPEVNKELTGSGSNITFYVKVNFLPKIDTFERNSSYILRLRIVEPIRIRRYESRSMPHNFTSVEDEAYIGKKKNKII